MRGILVWEDLEKLQMTKKLFFKKIMKTFLKKSRIQIEPKRVKKRNLQIYCLDADYMEKWRWTRNYISHLRKRLKNALHYLFIEEKGWAWKGYYFLFSSCFALEPFGVEAHSLL